MKDFYVCGTDLSITYIDDPKKNPFSIMPEQTSTVGIDGQNVEDLSLRNSLSLRDKFTIKRLPSAFSELFSKYHVGIGSLHVYMKGGFMKQHRDARLPDREGMPHVASLIVVRSNPGHEGGKLRVDIDGNPVVVFTRDIPSGDSEEYYAMHGGYAPYEPSYHAALIPINKIHDVTEVTYGRRESFVFPVYGVLKSYQEIAEGLRSNVKPNMPIRNQYEDVLECIKYYTTRAGKSDANAKLQGFIDSLGDICLSRMFVRYRFASGDYVLDERAHGVYADEYEYEPKVTIESITAYVTKLDNAFKRNNVRIERREIADQKITEDLKSAVDSLQVAVQNGVDDIDKKIEAVKKAAAIIHGALESLEDIASSVERRMVSIPDRVELPVGLFVYVAANMYYQDSKLENLIGVDELVYKTALESGRNVSLVISSMDTEDFIWPVYRLEGRTFVDVSKRGLPKSLIVYGNTEPIHDDQGGYDVRYKRVYCVLVIE